LVNEPSTVKGRESCYRTVCVCSGEARTGVVHKGLTGLYLCSRILFYKLIFAQLANKFTVICELRKFKLYLFVNQINPCQAHTFSLQSSILILSSNFEIGIPSGFIQRGVVCSYSVRMSNLLCVLHSHTVTFLSGTKAEAPSSFLAPKIAISTVTVPSSLKLEVRHSAVTDGRTDCNCGIFHTLRS